MKKGSEICSFLIFILKCKIQQTPYNNYICLREEFYMRMVQKQKEMYECQLKAFSDAQRQK